MMQTGLVFFLPAKDAGSAEELKKFKELARCVRATCQCHIVIV